jgi:hypothetical protein
MAAPASHDPAIRCSSQTQQGTTCTFNASCGKYCAIHAAPLISATLKLFAASKFRGTRITMQFLSVVSEPCFLDIYPDNMVGTIFILTLPHKNSSVKQSMLVLLSKIPALKQRIAIDQDGKRMWIYADEADGEASKFLLSWFREFGPRVVDVTFAGQSPSTIHLERDSLVAEATNLIDQWIVMWFQLHVARSLVLQDVTLSVEPDGRIRAKYVKNYERPFGSNMAIQEQTVVHDF